MMEMGGKENLIVMEDEDIDKKVDEEDLGELMNKGKI